MNKKAKFWIGVAVCEMNKEITGFVAWTKTDHLISDATHFSIVGLVVSTSHRGTGIGKKLMKFVEDIAKQHSPAIIDLASGLRRAQDGTHEFYKRISYQNEGHMTKLLFAERIMITGKCFCGEIHYTIEANILKSGICHCHDCQRLTGGTAWPFIVVPCESLVVQGKTKEFTRPGASGKPVHVSFCGKCGSTLFCKPEIWPHIRIVGASSLDDKTLFTPDMYVWTKDAPKWSLFDPNVPKFNRGSI